MAGIIRVTPDELRDRASQFAQKADDLRTFIGEMDTLTQQTLEEWEGDASEKFEGQWHDVKPTYEASAEALDTMNQQLTSTAQALEDTDAAAAAGIGVQ